MFKTLSTIVSLFLSFNAFAQLSHQATPEELQKIYAHPKYSETRSYTMDTPEWQPTMDVAKFKYVLVSGRPTNNEALHLKYTIARNLPQGMKMVVLTTPDSVEKYKADYAKLIAADKIVFAASNYADGGTWARDAFPVPAVDKLGRTTLIGAQYFRTFDGNGSIASSINFDIKQFQFVFVGGNILADENGVCFVIDSSRMFNTTEDDLKSAYGCKNIHAMKHISGIGDVDEVLKPVGNNTILTNTPEYVNQLKSWGYKVVSLPVAKSPSYPNRTYANSLVLNGTVFMPSYGLTSDAQAASVYESLGFKVIQIPSSELSDSYSGSVHCQTMAYPALNQADLFSALQLQAL
jgi:Porphyromonas-type peptidyl-arginine deiminase